MAKRKPDTAATPGKPITRADLEQGFLNIQRGARKEIADRKSTAITIGTVAGVVLVMLVFLLGRRSGRKKTTFVEIRRV